MNLLLSLLSLFPLETSAGRVELNNKMAFDFVLENFPFPVAVPPDAKYFLRHVYTDVEDLIKVVRSQDVERCEDLKHSLSKIYYELEKIVKDLISYAIKNSRIDRQKQMFATMFQNMAVSQMGHLLHEAIEDYTCPLVFRREEM